jgi:hypothetical protein
MEMEPRTLRICGILYHTGCTSKVQLASTIWFCPRDIITGTRGRRDFIPIIGIDPNHNDGEQPMTEETFRYKREDQLVSVKKTDVASNDVAV